MNGIFLVTFEEDVENLILLLAYNGIEEVELGLSGGLMLAVQMDPVHEVAYAQLVTKEDHVLERGVADIAFYLHKLGYGTSCIDKLAAGLLQKAA